MASLEVVRGPFLYVKVKNQHGIYVSSFFPVPIEEAEGLRGVIQQGLDKLRHMPNGCSMETDILQGFFVRQKLEGTLKREGVEAFEYTDWQGPYTGDRDEAKVMYCKDQELCEYCFDRCWDKENGPCEQQKNS